MRLLASLLFLVLAQVCLSSSVQPVGTVRLFSPGDDICNDSSWTNENVDGVRLRLAWIDYEPTEGSFLWDTDPGGCTGTPPSAVCTGTDLECAMGMAASTNKFIGVSMSTGSFTPHWVYDSAGAYKFNLDHGDVTSSGDPFMPLIWDTIFQAKFHNFLTAWKTYMDGSPYRSTIRYIVVTGVAKAIDMRTWCQNFDKSHTFTDGVLTDMGHIGTKDYTKVESATANFLSTSNPNNTAAFNGIVGEIMTDILDGGTQLRGNSQVCSQTNVPGVSASNDPNCPADPTNTVVYINKKTFDTACTPGTCSGNTITIEDWLVGLGEFKQMDDIAKTPPGGYAGLVGTANPAGMTGFTGNYVLAAETIIPYFFELFPNDNIILTESGPYAIPQGALDLHKIDDDMHLLFDDFGPMVVSRGSSCPPHGYQAIWTSFPKGSQAILPTGSGIYEGSCAITSPSSLEDLMGNMFDHNDKYWEIYPADLESIHQDLGTAEMVAMGRRERRRVHFANPQAQDRAKIKLIPTP